MTRSLFVSDILPMETTFSGGTPKFSQSGFLQVLTWISWTGGGTRGRSVRRGALLPRFGFLSSEEDICFTTTSPEPLDSGEYQPRNIRISPTLVNGLGSTSGAFSLPLCFPRSEERRVGKECVITCRSRWSPEH